MPFLALNRATGVLSWQFSTIDATTGEPITGVSGGFLPSDSSPPEEDGSVSFSVNPNAGLRTDAQLAIPGICGVGPSCGTVRPGISAGAATIITPSASRIAAVP